ncbi:hypothetical protein SAMN04487949_3862 [Halogranum gelatinilyticum]|uniref:Uncharacterized protein n=1 Tax=Halogranum gelatinilyticum TaxID=660521 RepID=A0A1H0A824_9EURY|nr:hypothetical protein [Halogranum gelatinilyticum]SDN29557.1 hypothetical protein SAMN04487949_3862 [Halogranum gelatinilyticum]
MEGQAVYSDKGIGFAMLFSLLAIGGAAVLLVAPGQVTKAWGFALAMVAASIAVVGTQAYWG